MPLWLTILLIWALIQFLTHNTSWLKERLSRFTQVKLQMNIQASGYTHLLHLPLNFHKNEHIQGMIQKISTAGWRVSNILVTFIEIFPQLLSVLIGFILVLTINFNLAFILIAGVAIYMVLLIIIVPPAAKLDEEAHNKWSEGYNDAVSSIVQIDSVKNSAAEQYEGKKITNSFMKTIYSPWRKLEAIWSNIAFFQSIIIFLTQFCVFIFSVSLIRMGIITVGELIAVNGYSAMFFGPFVIIGYTWQNFQNGLTSASQLDEILNVETEIYHPKKSVKKSIVGEINFDDVSFRYDNNSMVLNHINLKIRSGESIALVGKSGSGKSTLVSMISGYYFPTTGNLTIDGEDITKFDLTNLRKQIAIVPQEIALFNDTIENNIRYGSFEATLEQVKKVAKEAQLDEFITEQKDGYQAIVGERGVKLSVGQKQRLAIARAMLRDPKILILDEPTSALDSVTENFVTKAIHELMKGRTTIIIAHRLSTVRKADKIVVFEKGEIVETGNHSELLEKDNGYYKIMNDFQTN